MPALPDDRRHVIVVTHRFGKLGTRRAAAPNSAPSMQCAMQCASQSRRTKRGERHERFEVPAYSRLQPVIADLAIEEELRLLGRREPTQGGEFVPAEAVRAAHPRNRARLAARRAFRRAFAFCCFS